MISECCDAEDTAIGEDGPDYSDIGICPECKDNCTFVLGYSVYDFDGDKVEVFSDGTYYLNGKEATEEQRYEIDRQLKELEEG